MKFIETMMQAGRQVYAPSEKIKKPHTTYTHTQTCMCALTQIHAITHGWLAASPYSLSCMLG